MSPLSSLTLWIATGLLAALVVIAMAVRATRQRRAGLRQRYGPEYDRLVRQTGSHGRAERALADRPRARIELAGLGETDRLRFEAAWQKLETRFVDDPLGCVSEADALIQQVLTARGQPPQRIERITESSEVYGDPVLAHYRAVKASAHARRSGDTEQLRRALVHYRALFAELLRPEQGRGAALHEVHA